MYDALYDTVLITQCIHYITHWQFQKQVTMQCILLTKIHAENSVPVEYMLLGIFLKIRK